MWSAAYLEYAEKKLRIFRRRYIVGILTIRRTLVFILLSPLSPFHWLQKRDLEWPFCVKFCFAPVCLELWSLVFDFRSLATLKLVVNVVGELQTKKQKNYTPFWITTLHVLYALQTLTCRLFLVFTLPLHPVVTFSVAAPAVWNSLPSGIRDSSSTHTFRRLLKTHCFQ